VPSRPKLNVPNTVQAGKSPELDDMIRNVYTLSQHVETLEIMMETHNSAAEAHNKKVSQDLGVSK
jgi:hypothetical protein